MLCGGVSALVTAGFETLVEAGYQPEIAYFECLHELKLIVDLMYRGGLGFMRYSVSDTAEHGDYTGGPRMVTEETKNEMRKMLAEIRSGAYAEKLARDTKSGWFAAEREKNARTRSNRSAPSSARACPSWNRWRSRNRNLRSKPKCGCRSGGSSDPPDYARCRGRSPNPG